VSGTIEILDAGKVYETRGESIPAIASITLTIQAGEFISLVGASGCGKSTLLTLVAGLVSLSRGEIRIDGQTVTRPQTNIGFVFQDPVLLDWRRAVDNVLISVEARKPPLQDYRERAGRLLQNVGLGGFEHRYPYELSGGMRQRVSICRALIHDPPVLLMDEPFGALDALTREQLMLDLLKIWQERKKTVLFVTHSISEAVFLSDRVVVLTQRPARVQEIVTIDLPRPRGLRLQQSLEFAAYRDRILDSFKAQGILRE
jgi:NitT/TauT family transport system ATP-binding protein